MKGTLIALIIGVGLIALGAYDLYGATQHSAPIADIGADVVILIIGVTIIVMIIRKRRSKPKR
jgi:hypothetical protein